MTWLDFIVLTLAGSGAVDTWTNGSIFADWRAFFENKADDVDEPQEANGTDDDGGEPLPLAMRIADRVFPKLFAELISCHFCLSHHTPWILAILFLFPAMWVEQDWLMWLLKLPIYSLAATRLGNLITAAAPETARYHRDG